MLQGGGKLFLGSSGRYIGPGHFGLLDLGDGVQKFSCHYEADLDRGGISVLDIRPLLWRDGWPVAGENVTAGTYQIESVRTGTAIELAVKGCLSADARGRGGRGAGGRGDGRPAGDPIPRQEVAQVSANWPTRPIDLRMSPYMVQAQQKWTVTPVANAGGYPGSPYFKITIAGTDRALAATADRELDCASGIHRRTRTAMAHRSAHRRHVSRHAEGGARFDGAAGAVGRRQQHADARPSSAPTSDRQRWLLKTP